MTRKVSNKPNNYKSDETNEKTIKKDNTIKRAIIFSLFLLLVILVLNIQYFISYLVITPEDTKTLTTTLTEIITATSTDTPTQTSTAISSDTATSSDTVTFTVSSTATATFTVTSTATATFTSTYPAYTTKTIPTSAVNPIIINGNPLFRIEDWKDTYSECGAIVTIYGVTISHGNPPYTFVLWTQKEPFTPYVPSIRSVKELNNSRDYVEFTPPLFVVKGKPKHVELVFQRDDGADTIWIDDFFYPVSKDPSCQ